MLTNGLMMKKLFIKLFLQFVLFSLTLASMSAAKPDAAVNPVTIESIRIIDSKNNQMYRLTDDKQLNRFKYLWSQKKPFKNQRPFKWRYQLIIPGSTGETKWVYDPEGYTRKLSVKQTTTIYHLSTTRSFNRFLEKVLTNNG